MSNTFKRRTLRQIRGGKAVNETKTERKVVGHDVEIQEEGGAFSVKIDGKPIMTAGYSLQHPAQPDAQAVLLLQIPCKSVNVRPLVIPVSGTLTPAG